MTTKTKIRARVTFALIAQSKLVATTPKLNLPTNDRSISTASREAKHSFWLLAGPRCVSIINRVKDQFSVKIHGRPKAYATRQPASTFRP
jgi:hypothetical protein